MVVGEDGDLDEYGRWEIVLKKSTMRVICQLGAIRGGDDTWCSSAVLYVKRFLCKLLYVDRKHITGSVNMCCVTHVTLLILLPASISATSLSIPPRYYHGQTTSD